MFCLLYCSIMVTVRVLIKYLYSIYVLFTLNDFIHALSFCFYVALFSYSFLFSSLGYNGGISFVRIQSGKIFILFPTQENWYAFSVIRFIFSTYFHLDYLQFRNECGKGDTRGYSKYVVLTTAMADWKQSSFIVLFFSIISFRTENIDCTSWLKHFLLKITI